MEIVLITFEEAMASIPAGVAPSILLANGFSRAWRNDIFDYANILAAADFLAREREIRDLFERFKTYDFEVVMRALIAAKTVLEAYGGNEPLIEEIEKDREILKESLISAISITHPDRPSSVSTAQFTAARSFLSRFEQIFSVNYDLLLYWARNMNDLPPENYRTNDGFWIKGIWLNQDDDQKVHFLHGGLHIFDTGASIKKHSFSESGTGIVDLVRDNLEEGRFPLFVSEPDATSKLERISHNPYLNHCFRALGKANGIFFVHGHSFDENDKHIFDQLKKSGVVKFFVSIFGDENTEENTRVKANARAFLESDSSEVEFYIAESSPIWA